MKQNKLRRLLFAVSISALAFPAFVQSQTSSGGSSPGSVASPPSTTESMGVEETPGVAGSPQMDEGSRSPGRSSLGETDPSTSVMADRGTTQTDRDLNQKIRQELTSDSTLRTSANNVHFNTDNGKVTLHGTVTTEQEKQDIENKVEMMTGVKDVDNQLQIASTSQSGTLGLGAGAGATR